MNSFIFCPVFPNQFLCILNLLIRYIVKIFNHIQILSFCVFYIKHAFYNMSSKFLLSLIKQLKLRFHSFGIVFKFSLFYQSMIYICQTFGDGVVLLLSNSQLEFSTKSILNEKCLLLKISYSDRLCQMCWGASSPFEIF